MPARRLSVPCSLLLLLPAPVRAQPATPATAATAATAGGPSPAFGAYAERAMRDWQVPGLAIVVVRDTTIVFARGYGVRQLGRPEAVDAQTVFGVGSITKAFTATLLGMSVDDGGLRWDDPVARHLPGFQFAEPDASRELTVRDALAHRSGLGRADMLWYGVDRPREDVVRRLRFVRPVAGLRERFNYQNVLYVVAGEIVRARTGRPWDEVMRIRLLAPLGMRGASTSVRALAANVAQPHAMVDDTLRVLPYRNVDNAAAAAGLNASAADLARWVRFQLDSGRVAGRPLVSAGTFQQLRQPQMVIPLGPAARRQNPHRHLRAYGMGWYLEDYRGRELVYHNGTTDGMGALVALLPEERLGLVVLVNRQSTDLPTALMYRLFDEALGAPPTDWSARLLADRERAVARGRAFEAEDARGRVPGTRPSLPLAAYAGTYADSAYGEVRVSHADGRLTISAGPGLRGALEHWHFDTFRTRWEGVLAEGTVWAAFVLDRTGAPAQLRLDIEGPVTFTRVSAPSSPAQGPGR